MRWTSTRPGRSTATPTTSTSARRPTSPPAPVASTARRPTRCSIFDFPIRGTSKDQDGLDEALKNNTFCKALEAYDPSFLKGLRTTHNTNVAGNMSFVSFGDQLLEAIKEASK
mmetsp:Transcript_18574/g.59992  ORF Transcript_18574/g.59992 Transcript_18574/m.59992 type:complete len:113 (+) Transcript_18574:1616-1954(+)